MAGSDNTEGPDGPATVQQPSAAELEKLLFEEAYLDMQAEARGDHRLPGPWQLAYPKGYALARQVVVGLGVMAASGAVAIQRAKTLAKMLDDKDEGATAIGAVVGQPASEFMRGVMLTHLLRLTKAKPRQGKVKVPDDVLRELWARAVACLPNGSVIVKRKKKVLAELRDRGMSMSMAGLHERLKELGLI